MTKEDELYFSIIDQCEEANKLIDLGYILLDEEGNVKTGKFVFNFMRTEGIYLLKERNYAASYLHKDKRDVHGEDTILQEYKTALRYLKKIKFIPITNTIYPFKTTKND